jgi:hypothetical protein
MKYVTKDKGEFVYLYAETEFFEGDVPAGTCKEPLITYSKKRKRFSTDAIFTIDEDILKQFILTCTTPKVCNTQVVQSEGDTCQL